MAIYYATFNAVAVTLAQDVFEITSPASIKVAIRSILLGQFSDAAAADDELINIQLIRGFTVTGSGGTTLTPVNRTGIATASAASSVVKANNTTLANTGTTFNPVSDVWNVKAGWVHRPLAEERLILQPSTRLVCRMSAPADVFTANGTLVFEELGVDPLIS